MIGYFSPDDGAGFVFFPTSPCRAVDTRPSEGFAGEFGPPVINAGFSRAFTVPNSVCGIPASALAYSMNLTVVPAQPLGFVTVWPAGGLARPLVSTLNSFDGRTTANGLIAAACVSGAVSVFASDATHVIVDINGFFGK